MFPGKSTETSFNTHIIIVISLTTLFNRIIFHKTLKIPHHRDAIWNSKKKHSQIFFTVFFLSLLNSRSTVHFFFYSHIRNETETKVKILPIPPCAMERKKEEASNNNIVACSCRDLIAGYKINKWQIIRSKLLSHCLKLSQIFMSFFLRHKQISLSLSLDDESWVSLCAKFESNIKILIFN